MLACWILPAAVDHPEQLIAHREADEHHAVAAEHRCVPPTYSLRPPAPFVRWPEPVRPCGLRDRVRPAVGLHRHAAPVLTAQRAGGEGDALQPSETAGGRATAHDRMRALWHTRPHTHTRAPRNTHADPHAHVRTYTQRHQCSATARACANGALSMGSR